MNKKMTKPTHETCVASNVGCCIHRVFPQLRELDLTDYHKESTAQSYVKPTMSELSDWSLGPLSLDTLSPAQKT